jgi:COP9 signalosome complex subunit 4
MKGNGYKCCELNRPLCIPRSVISTTSSAAVTCAVLAPAGPNRSRVLASLYRDERTMELPTHNILSKMFLDQIIRSAEVKTFEGSLKPHQLAKIGISSNDRLASANDDNDDVVTSDSKRTGPSTVLDRAVMEHNLLASSKIYKNITFRGLGALLDLAPGAAETMARKMIEQGRLRGTIDQVDKLIWFYEGRDQDDAQGKAGGLGDVDLDAEETGAPFTKRWDMQIRLTAANVRIYCLLVFSPS